MSRIAKTLPVSTKMYRNFAIATVFITICLAVFVDGGKSAALEAELAAQKLPNAPMNKDSVKVASDARHGLQRRNSASTGSFGPDPVPDSDGGGGGGGFFADSSSNALPPGQMKKRRPPIRKLADGRMIVGLGEGEVGKPGPWLEGADQDSGGAANQHSVPSAEQIEAMTAASRERSGSDE